jgi:hypothetical protein
MLRKALRALVFTDDTVAGAAGPRVLTSRDRASAALISPCEIPRVTQISNECPNATPLVRRLYPFTRRAGAAVTVVRAHNSRATVALWIRRKHWLLPLTYAPQVCVRY